MCFVNIIVVLSCYGLLCHIMLMPFRLTPTDARPIRRVTTGKRGEMQLTAHLTASAKAGAGFAVKQHVPFAIVGSHADGTWVCRPLMRSSVDFVGVLAGGRSVWIECKSVTPSRRLDGSFAPPRFPLSSLPEHQRATLASAHKLGAAAVVVLVVGTPATLYAVPWTVVARALERGAVSLLADDVNAYRVPPTTTLLAFVARLGE